MKKLSLSPFVFFFLLVVLGRCLGCGGNSCQSCKSSSFGGALYPNSLSSFGNTGSGSDCGKCGIGSTFGNGFRSSLSSGYGDSMQSDFGSSLTSGFGSSLSSGYGLDFDAGNGGINPLDYNSNQFGGFNTNIGSLGIGNGVGLQTTGLNFGTGDASFVLNTPSLTGTTFTNNQFANNANSNPGTITAVTTTTLPPNPSVTTITGLPSIPEPAKTVTTIKVKDTTGNIVQVNGYDPTRTTQSVVIRDPIESFNIYKKVTSVNTQDIVRDTLNQDDTLSEGQYLRSSNKAYYAVLQRDGNFVVYCSKVWIAKNSIWNSNTVQRGESGARKLVLTNTGNLILYSGNINNQIWTTNTAGGSGPFTLIMQGDGNLVLYDKNRNVKWSTNTRRD